MTTRINRYLEAVSSFDNIEIDLIRCSENPLRNSNGDINALAISIREHGLLQPILVRPKKNRFEVIAGNRRLEACKRLKHRKIKAVVFELDDKVAYEIALTENVQRKTLDPIEEARAFNRYCMEFGWGSQTELARKIGKSQEYVSHRIRLLSLPEDVKNAIIEKRLSPTSGEELIWLRDEESKNRIGSLICEEKLSMLDVRKLVKSVNSSQIGLSVGDVEDKLSMTKNDSYALPQYRGDEDKTEREISKILTESVLVLRIALIRLDDLSSRCKDPQLRQLLITERRSLHSIIDDLISAKKQGVPISPQLLAAERSRRA